MNLSFLFTFLLFHFFTFFTLRNTRIFPPFLHRQCNLAVTMAIRASHFAMIRPFAYHLRRGFRSNSSIIGDKSKSARPNKNYIHRSLSVSDRSIDDSLQDNKRRGRRVWKAREESDFNIRLDHPASIGMPPKLWYKAVDDGDHQMVHESLLRICDQVRLI